MPAGYQENKIGNEEVKVSLYADDVKSDSENYAREFI